MMTFNRAAMGVLLYMTLFALGGEIPWLNRAETRSPAQTAPAKPAAALPAPTAAPQPPGRLSVEFDKSTALSIAPSSPGTYRAVVFVKNTGELDATIRLCIETAEVKGSTLRQDIPLKDDASEIAAGEMKAVSVEIPVAGNKAPLSGYLILEASAAQKNQTAKKAWQYREVLLATPVTPPSRIADDLMRWTGWAAAAIFVVTLLWLLVAGLNPLGRMGSPGWNFGDSWGSNVTVGAGLLTTLLAFTYLPTETFYMTKPAYQSLSLIFVAMTTLAPAIYGLIRVPGNGENEGFVICFLMSSTLMAWAGLGQLGTVALLFAELERAKLISQTAMTSLLVPLAISGLWLMAYACRTVIQLARQHQAPPPAGAAARAVALPRWNWP